MAIVTIIEETEAEAARWADALAARYPGHVFRPAAAAALNVAEAAGSDIVVVPALSSMRRPAAGIAFELAAALSPPALVLTLPAASEEPCSSRSGAIHWTGRDGGPESLAEVIRQLTGGGAPRATLADLWFEDVLHLAILTHWSGSVSVRHQQRSGRVSFDAGEPVHASFGTHEGLDALAELLSTPDGAVVVDRTGTAAPKNLSLPAAQLLSEALPLAEERRREKAEAAAWEISDVDLAALAGEESPARMAMDSLFSDVELEAMALDDTMATPLEPRGAKASVAHVRTRSADPFGAARMIAAEGGASAAWVFDAGSAKATSVFADALPVALREAIAKLAPHLAPSRVGEVVTVRFAELTLRSALHAQGGEFAVVAAVPGSAELPVRAALSSWATTEESGA
jgi:hypothetical protein